MENLTNTIYKSSKTIFTNKDLALLWKETNSTHLKAKIAYYVKKKILIRLTRGVFAKTSKYDGKELATSLYTPSYISFETALREAGIIFQHYDTIFIASSLSKEISINNTNIIFRKLKDSVLYNPQGIENKEDYSIASPERAFLDTLYLFPQYYFDNLQSLNWETCFELVTLYSNQQLMKRLKHYQENYAQ